MLRHRPESIGLTLDARGWAQVSELVLLANAAGVAISRSQLVEVVETNDKKRFTLSPDGQRIRACQGHSVGVDLGLAPTHPPAQLYHGTGARSLAGISEEGLRPQQRLHVHLSATVALARSVAERRCSPVVLTVDARAMAEQGHEFFLAENGVWLTAYVPPAHVRFPSDLCRVD